MGEGNKNFLNGTFLFNNGSFLVFAALMGYALKYHYSRATAADLSWILSPTACAVQLLTGITLEMEESVGFMSRESAIAIIPACAGVNFMIAAFFLLFISIVCPLNRTGPKLVGIVVSAAAAYFTAIVVNGLRISSLVFFKSWASAGGMSTEGIHRIGGALIYMFFLLMMCPIGRRVFVWLSGLPGANAAPCRKPVRFGIVRAALLPFFCYLSVAIGIPILNGGWRQNAPKFIEHCTQVISVCLVLLSVYSLAFWIYGQNRRTHSRGQ